ncbi:MAG: pantoate--beta-alanine ligase [Defluviitaleaceae bacterium]|nr:pantoate--beta-alanine ligase [Defluviitaleaceae bacterium]
MIIANTIQEVRAHVYGWKKYHTIGFVPTMGYLHEGHLSLIERSVAENAKTIVSIFVNPMQFSPTEDLDKYPRDLESDKAMCRKAGANLIFYPQVEEIYPKDFYSYVDMEGLTKELCGKTRANHFRGVCTVVNKLFNIVAADRAYFGQKDAQQLAVIKKMVRDLNMDIEIIGCPIIREVDGLAKSSRNSYLSLEERKAAQVVSQAIFKGEELVKSGEISAKNIIESMTKIVQTEPLAKIDYIEIVDLDTLEKIQEVTKPTLGAVAIYIGKTRLIDNFAVY